MFFINTKFFERLRQASRWFVLLLLACLTGGFAQAQTLSLSPGQVTNLTWTHATTDNPTGSAAANYTGPLSGLILNMPQALTYDSQGDLFIVDAGANVVRVVASGKGKIPSLPSVASPQKGTVYTVAGSGSSTPSSSPLCTADERSTIDTNFYGNGCLATDAILFLLTANDFNHQTINPGWQLTAPIGQVALDGSGNLYIADAGDNQVRVVYAGGTVPGLTGVTPIPGNIYAFAGSPANQSTSDYNPDSSSNLPPIGVVVDATGDVYILFCYPGAFTIGDYGMYNLAVVSNGGTLPPILAGNPNLTTGQFASIFPNTGSYIPPWQTPASIALDPSGNIYISDSSYNATNSVYVIYAGGTVPGLSETLKGQDPVVGNVYLFAGSGTKVPAYAPSVPATEADLSGASTHPTDPTQLAIDSAGDLYVGLYNNNSRIGVGYIAKVDPSANLALVAGSLNIINTSGLRTQVVCAAAVDGFGDGCPANQVSVNGPWGVVVAPDGSIDYADMYQVPGTSNNSFALHKIDGSTSALQFPTATAGVASSAQTVTISNVDAQPLNISDLNIPNNFIQVASGGTDCSTPATLTAGQSCELSIEFLPTSGTASGETFSDNVTITSNSTNATSEVNSIAVSGTATATTGTSTQSIKNFTPPSTATYGQTITLTATATSGLPVLYQVTSGPGVISGNTLTVTAGSGNIVVTAYQPGDNSDTGNSAGWQAATPVQATIAAQPALLIVKAGNISQARTLPIPSLADDYTITVTINGVTSPAPASATTGAPKLSTTADPNSAKDYPITIVQDSLTTTTSNYSLTAASFVPGTFTVQQGVPQTVAFTQTLPTVTYGIAPINLTGVATAVTSGYPVTYTATGPATTSGVNGTTLTITGQGTVTVTASQMGDSIYAPASATQQFQVNPATLIFTADNLTMAQGSTPPTLTYKVGGVVSPDTAAAVESGAPTLATTATSSSPVGATIPITIAQGKVTLLSKNYTLTSASFVPGTMTVVTGTPQTIVFGALPNVTYGVAPIVLSATASSNLPVTFSVSGPASITGGVLSVTGAGSVVVTANQSGNSSYSPAPPASQSFTVAQATLTIAANSMTIVDNITIPPLTYTVTGLLNGDTPAVLSGTPVISTTATAGSPVGTYPINVGPLDGFGNPITATSYTINTFVPGTLTITSNGPAQDFTTALSAPILTILDGRVGQVTLTVNPVYYYSGTLNLSCTGLPANVSCVFSPSSLSVPAKLSGTLSISTSNAAIVGSLRKSGNTIYSAAIACWASLLFGVILAWQRKRLARYKAMWVIAMVAVLFGVAASITACGGKTSTTSSGLAAPGTTTIQVVATDANGGPTHSIPLVITVK